MSCHAAAARFGVTASSAIKWIRRVRETGSAAPGQIGGHKPNILSGPNRDWLLERIATDFTLGGLATELAMRGVKVDYVRVWRFVHAEGLSFKVEALKHLMRKAAERSHEATWRRMGSLLNAFTATECDNSLRNAGYGAH